MGASSRAPSSYPSPRSRLGVEDRFDLGEAEILKELSDLSSITGDARSGIGGGCS